MPQPAWAAQPRDSRDSRGIAERMVAYQELRSQTRTVLCFFIPGPRDSPSSIQISM